MTRFITLTLKLEVNETKSAVARLHERRFLGSRFAAGREVKRVIAPSGLDRSSNDSGSHTAGQGRQHRDDDRRAGFHTC